MTTYKSGSDRSSMKYALLYTGMLLIGVAITLFVNYLLSRKFPPGGYGDFSLIVRNATLIAVILTYGFDLSANRYLPMYLHTQEFSAAKGFLWRSLQVFVLNSIIFIVVLLLVFGVCVYMANKQILIFDFSHQIGWLWLAILIALANLGTIFLQVVRRANLGLLFGSIFQQVVLLVGVVFLLAWPSQSFEDLTFTLNITAFSYICSILILLIFAKMYLYSRLQQYPANAQQGREWVRVSRSMSFYKLVTRSMMVIPLNIVEMLNRSVTEAEVGILALALVVAESIGLIPNLTVKATIMPLLSPLHKANRHADFQRLILRSNWSCILFNGGLALLLILFHEPILKLFDSTYAAMLWPTSILLVAYMFDPSMTATRSALMVLGAEDKMVRTRLVGLVVLVVAGLVGTYFFGIVGMSVAFLLSQLVSACLNIYCLQKIGYHSVFAKT